MEDGELFCCPDIGREFSPPLRCRTEKIRDFAERALLSFSDGGTSQPTDVVGLKLDAEVE